MAVTEKRTMTLNMGPQHPSTHGVLRLILELDGEIVVAVTPVVGYLHRAIGKIGETLRYEQFVPYTDRLDYLAATINNLGYVQAVEKLAGIEAPRRALYLRVLFCELSRIESHLIWLGTHILDLGATTPLFYCFREREAIRDLFEEVCGARMTHAYMRIGGVRQDVPAGFLQKVREFTRTFPGRLEQYEALITNNPIFLRRARGIGVIPAEKAVNYGLSGPSLRGSGVKWDIRKAEPYAAYGELDFDIPVGRNGDVYDRYLVRIAEMRQSLRLIEQAAEGLPEGPARAEAPQFIRPPREEVHRSMQAMARYFYITMHGGSPPPGGVLLGRRGQQGGGRLLRRQRRDAAARADRHQGPLLREPRCPRRDVPGPVRRRPRGHHRQHRHRAGRGGPVSATAKVIPARTRERLRELFERFPRKPDALLTALYIVQEDCDNHLSEKVLDELASIMEMPKSIIYEVVTFYHLYSTKPRGRHIILICQNLCCYLGGSDEIYRAVYEALGIRPGETTEDGRFTLETAECLAACERAPAMMVNDQTFGPVDPDRIGEILERFP